MKTIIIDDSYILDKPRDKKAEYLASLAALNPQHEVGASLKDVKIEVERLKSQQKRRWNN